MEVKNRPCDFCREWLSKSEEQIPCALPYPKPPTPSSLIETLTYYQDTSFNIGFPRSFQGTKIVKEFELGPLPADPYDAFLAGVVDETAKHFGCAHIVIKARKYNNEVKILFVGNPLKFGCQKIFPRVAGQLSAIESVEFAFYYSSETLVTRIIHSRCPRDGREGFPIASLGLKPTTVLLANQVAVSIPTWRSGALTVAEFAAGLIVAEEHDELRKLLCQHQLYYHLKSLKYGYLLADGDSLWKYVMCRNFRWVFRNPFAVDAYDIHDEDRVTTSYLACEIYGIWTAHEKWDVRSMPLELILRMPTQGQLELWDNTERVSGEGQEKLMVKTRKIRF